MEINMRNLRSRNLITLRYLYDGLGKLAKLLDPIANEAALIKMGQEKKEISDETSRKIEEVLGLPKNWMDRENDQLIMMSELDYRIVKKIMSMADDKKRGLEKLLS